MIPASGIIGCLRIIEYGNTESKKRNIAGSTFVQGKIPPAHKQPANIISDNMNPPRRAIIIKPYTINYPHGLVLYYKRHPRRIELPPTPKLE